MANQRAVEKSADQKEKGLRGLTPPPRVDVGEGAQLTKGEARDRLEGPVTVLGVVAPG